MNRTIVVVIITAASIAGILIAAAGDSQPACRGLSKELRRCRLGNTCEPEKIERLRALCKKQGGEGRE